MPAINELSRLYVNTRVRTCLVIPSLGPRSGSNFKASDAPVTNTRLAPSLLRYAAAYSVEESEHYIT